MPIIVFEGIDGSGKSTHAKRLSEALGVIGASVHHPLNSTHTGEAVRAHLSERGAWIAPDTRQALLLAAHAELWRGYVIPRWKLGETVIVDRGLWSYQAYSECGNQLNDEMNWVIACGAARAQYDTLHVYMDVSVNVAQARTAQRAVDTLHPPTHRLNAVKDTYEGLLHNASRSAQNHLVVTHGAGTSEDVIAQFILERVQKWLGERR